MEETRSFTYENRTVTITYWRVLCVLILKIGTDKGVVKYELGWDQKMWDIVDQHEKYENPYASIFEHISENYIIRRPKLLKKQ